MTGGSGGSTTVDPVLLRADFQKREAGTYTEAMVEGDFGTAPESSNRSRATAGQDRDRRRRALPARDFPGQQVRPDERRGTVQGRAPGELRRALLVVSGPLRRKLPVREGRQATGPRRGHGSHRLLHRRRRLLRARHVAHSGQRAAQFVYYPEKESSCEEEIDYELDGDAFSFERGTWVTVEHHVVMNTAGEADGALEAWIDGTPVLAVSDFVYRVEDATFGIDTFFFSTYFGGTDLTYAPKIAQTLDYDDFIVSTAPITH